MSCAFCKVSSVSSYGGYPVYMTRTDLEHHFNSSQSCFSREEPSIKNVTSVGAQKNVIYSKLVNNPFKEGVPSATGIFPCTHL